MCNPLILLELFLAAKTDIKLVKKTSKNVLKSHDFTKGLTTVADTLCEGN